MLSFIKNPNRNANGNALANQVDHTYQQCPKCGYGPLHDLPDSAKCPACGIYFFKWVEASNTSDLIKAENETMEK